MRRETAWRVFAGEYNDSTFEIKGRGEKTPSYIITPLGAKINRLFIVGVLTDVENISETGELLRAHISDPTGVFTLYSGQYQPDATKTLLNIDVPTFVALVGKARTFEPEEGALYVSIRPEVVREVDAEARDRWIIETCRHTKNRIDAIREAMKMSQPNIYDLRKLGYSRDLSEGIVTAIKRYGQIDINKYLTLLYESLQYIMPAKEKTQDVQNIIETKEKTEKTEEIIKAQIVESYAPDELEDKILEIIKEIEGEDGAAWDAIIEKCEKTGFNRDSVEEALNSLMDKGLIYEPVLGTIKTT
ncbi:MAG: hypothetical protein DRN08_03655 [Thermoplasmata archaeon]|nr:MAG: hypothetical protein DRN05_02415 [Thermoplasmata archaeon]RLF35070.1 MAG: hypothetical protein DRN08_03655 [Thermoplasmata archaeon]